MFWKKKTKTYEEELAAARKEYATLVERKLKAGVPRQHIWNELMSLKLKDLASLTARAEAEHAVATVMVDRNLRGKELEAKGKLDQAIPLYEANLVARSVCTQPGERLRLNSTARKNAPNSIPFC